MQQKIYNIYDVLGFNFILDYKFNQIFKKTDTRRNTVNKLRSCIGLQLANHYLSEDYSLHKSVHCLVYKMA